MGFARWAVWGVVSAVAGAALLRFGMIVYLGSSHGKAAVADQLQSLIGLPVEVAEVDLGAHTSAVKFRVLDPTGPARGELLAVESASADVSFAEVFAGRVAPKEVALSGVRLSLRVGADGTILTNLPPIPESWAGAIPAVAVEDAWLAVKQADRPAFALSGVRVRVQPVGTRLVLSGTIDDPVWGRWVIAGEADRAAKTGWAELTTDDAPLDVETLRSIPFVPAQVWDHVRPAGRGAATLRAEVGADRAVRYSATVKPHAARLELPGLQVTLADVTGTIRVRENAVELADCAGTIAGGTATVTGTFDLVADAATADLRVSVTDIDVRRLPSAWGVPQDFAGRLRGQAALRLTLHPDGDITARGAGSGAIDGPRLPGRPADLPLKLRSADSRLHFDRAN